MALDPALLRDAIDAVRDGVLVVGSDGKVLFYNQPFAGMFGLPSADGTHDAVAEALERTLDHPMPPGDTGDEGTDRGASARQRLKDGRTLERHVACLPSAHQGGPVRVVTYRDITREADAEAALEERRVLLERAEELAHVGSWVAPLDGSHRITWSPEICRIHGIAPGTFDGTADAAFAFVHEEDRDEVARVAQEALGACRPYRHEHRIVRPDGTVRWVQSNAHVMRGPGGNPLWLVGTMEDTTERRELEQQLMHAQKMEAIGRLAGGVAHDLNNTLTAIAGFAELALSDLPADAPARNDVAEVRRAAERAGAVTRQLLAFSRRKMLEPRLFDLGELVANLGRFLGRLLGENIELVTEVAPALTPALGDPGQVEQAVTNLAVNARDAMPHGGRLHLSVSLDEVGESVAHAHPPMKPGRYLVLTVADTGHGMTPETRERIFEPFFTTKPTGKGTGLGLAMVYSTMKQSGGFVFVESQPGAGSTFRLYFPPAEPAARPPAGAPPSPSQAPTVLVVDDDPSVRALVIATLRAGGYRILQAASGEEAIRVAADAGHAIDLLLTDATMPGMTGFDLAQQLLAKRPRLPVIVMSGYTADHLGLSQLRGSISVCQKPFTPRDLRERVRQALGR